MAPHLATALGFAACTQGKRVRFASTTALVTELLEAIRAGVLHEEDVLWEDQEAIGHWYKADLHGLLRMLIQHPNQELAKRIVEAAHAFSSLVENYNDAHLRDKYNQDVDNAERAADRVTHEVNKAIHKTFITPIDREQIHSLINTMDDVADLIQDSAETMALYDIHHMTDEIKRLTDLSLKCCERVRDAVKLLDFCRAT